MIDQKTTNQEYPLPDPSNKLSEDVLRIQDTFEKIDVDVGILHTASTNASTEIDNIRNGSVWQVTSTGFGAAYQVALSPAPSALTVGQIIYMAAHVQNTGPATLDVNGLGATAIKKTDGSDLRAGDILIGAVCHLNYDGTNFQLLNPKVDQEQTEINTSNIMRAFEEIQESHGGSLNMEAGWSDSFSNPNEQGADEANSAGYEHDAVNTLYQGLNSGIGANSDKDYDTEANFLQQEWTNSLPATGQATVTNGNATVTLVSGNWPTNCAKGRISFDSGSTWYNIDTRTDNSNIQLSATATEASENYNYTIQMSKLALGKYKLNEVFGAGYGPNIATGATATSNSTVSSGPIGNLIDGNTGTHVDFSHQAFPRHVRLEFTSDPVIITKTRISIYGEQAQADGVNFTIDGSNDASNWDQLHSETNYFFVNGTTYDDFTFSNVTAYTYYRVNLTTNQNGNHQIPRWYDLQMMEATKEVPINEYISISDTEIQKTDTSAWSDINSGSVTETLNSQNVYYWLALDPASSFGNGTEIKVFNTTGAVWRKIARNNSDTWEYNNNPADDAVETWAASTTNNMLHAISQAISTQTANRMTGSNLAAVTDIQWEESEGWSTSVNSIVRGVTLYSNNSSQNPSIAQYRLNHDSEREAMDLKSKAYDPGFVPSEAYVWTRAEHSDADGAGTFSVSRNSGAQWEVVPMTQQGLSFGDIRVMRGTVDLGTQPSGQDLRCRYQTAQGKDQFLHSWGLQAKS
jgi:hypothetical protein